MQLVEMYIYKSFYLAWFCVLFYSKARVRIHVTESFCLEHVDAFWSDILQSRVEEVLVSSRYPYKNVFINNIMQQQLAQADVVLR